MELQVFENSEFGCVRTLVDAAGRVLFCGGDVAKSLGYANSRKALADHCRCVTKRDVPHPQNPDKRLALAFIPEPDVYRLIFRSKLPGAERFEAWVVETVLPSIRRHGAYIAPDVLAKMEQSPEFTERLVELLKRERMKSCGPEQQMAVLLAKSGYFDKLVDTKTLTNIRQTAKELRIPERLFTYLLVEMGFAYRTPKRLLMPYAFMVTCGFAEMKEYTNGKHGGVYMLFTPVGRLYLERKISQRLAVKHREVKQDESHHNG